MQDEGSAFLRASLDHGSFILFACVLVALAALVIIRNLRSRRAGKKRDMREERRDDPPGSDEALRLGDILSELTELKAAVNDLTMSVHSIGDQIADLRTQLDPLAGQATQDWSWTLTLSAEPDELHSGLDPLVAELRSVVSRHYQGKDDKIA